MGRRLGWEGDVSEQRRLEQTLKVGKERIWIAAFAGQRKIYIQAGQNRKELTDKTMLDNKAQKANFLIRFAQDLNKQLNFFTIEGPNSNE